MDSARFTVSSLVVEIKKKVWGIGARPSCDVNVIIPGDVRSTSLSHCLVFWVLSVISRRWPLLSTPLHFDMHQPLFLSKSYIAGKSDVFHSQRLKRGGVHSVGIYSSANYTFKSNISSLWGPRIKQPHCVLLIIIHCIWLIVYCRNVGVHHNYIVFYKMCHRQPFVSNLH